MNREICLPESFSSIDKRKNWKEVEVNIIGGFSSGKFQINSIGPFFLFTDIWKGQHSFMIFAPNFTPNDISTSGTNDLILISNSQTRIEHVLGFSSIESKTSFLIYYFEILTLLELHISEMNPENLRITGEFLCKIPTLSIPQRSIGKIKSRHHKHRFEILLPSMDSHKIGYSLSLSSKVIISPCFYSTIFGFENIINTFSIGLCINNTEKNLILLCNDLFEVITWVLSLYSFSNQIGRNYIENQSLKNISIEIENLMILEEKRALEIAKSKGFEIDTLYFNDNEIENFEDNLYEEYFIDN